jgi:hypothetical protein
MQPERFRPPWWLLLVLLAFMVLGAFTLGGGLIVDARRTWANVLLVSDYLAGLAAGSLVLVALLYVTGARWAIPLRRLPEAIALCLPVAAVGLVGVWLTRPFVLLRTLCYLAAWMLFAFLIVRNSRRQDESGDPALTASNNRLSAGFLVTFGVTCWWSSSDWLMSLEPEWSSTIFPVYQFAGIFLSALAAVTLLAVCLRRVGALADLVTEDSLHDLGTLLFGFSSFWMYTWFCQYLLIWFTNHPDESEWIRKRSSGPWLPVLAVCLVLNWGIPFVVLLFRDAKRSGIILALVAVAVLAGRWADLCLVIFPSQDDLSAAPGVIETGIALGALGLFALAVLKVLGQAPLTPLKAECPPGQPIRREGEIAGIRGSIRAPEDSYKSTPDCSNL